MAGRITIDVPDGTFHAYVARPIASPAPSVVVLHEVFGVNADMRQTCDELAAKGFLALCPDLFWRQQQDVDLDVRSEAGWNKGLELYQAYDRDQGVRDIVRVVEVARALDGASGKVAVMGFCLGALMTFLTTARSSVDAAVAYHGADTEKYLGEAGAISAPLLMHLGTDDEFIPPEAQAAIKRALAGKPDVQIYSYPGRRHAFARHGGAHFDPEAAALANGRTWSFLTAALS